MKIMKRIISTVLAVVLVIGFAPFGEFADLDWSALFLKANAASGTGGYREFNGHYYEAFDISLRWTEAKTKCEELGGHLVTITTHDEAAFVRSLIQQGNRGFYWIGLTDERLEGIYEWITGEKYVHDSWYWESGEPNNDGDEDYIEMRKESGKWNDGENDGDSGEYQLENHGFVCEWEGSPAIDLLQTIKTQNFVVSYGKLEYVEDAVVTNSYGKTVIEADNYYTARFPEDDLVASALMTYAAVPTSTNSHISAVHCNGFDALVGAEYVKFPINGSSEKDKNRDVKITVYSDLGTQDISKYQLLKGQTVLEENETGVFNLKAKDIPSDYTLKARIINVENKKYAIIDTNIKTYDTTTTGKFADNKISITFPDDLKIIGGWSFDLDLSSLPFFVLKDEDTIKIGVGASENSEWDKLKSNVNDGEDTTSYYDSDGTAEALWKDWKKAVQDAKKEIKDNFNSVKKSYKNLKWFSGLACKMKGLESGLSPVSVDAKAALYLELKYKDGKWTQAGADGFVSLSASLSASTYMLVFYVPVEFKITGEVGASADVSILYDTENAKWDYGGTLELTLPSITGSATIGIPKVLNGGGFVNLTNTVKVTLRENIKGTVSGELGVQGQFVIFSGKKSLWKFLDWEYMNMDLKNSFPKHARKRTIDLSDVGCTDDVFEASSYSLDSRAYLENQSVWRSGQPVRSGAKKAPDTASVSTTKLLQSSVYPQANPQIVSTPEGKRMMVWTTDRPERSDGNQAAVVYSLYDAKTDAWSAPAVVYDDGTADAFPDVATDGENIYITWVNANRLFDPSATMEDFACECEICTAKYNPESGEFEDVKTVTKNQVYDFMPAIYARDGEVWLAYAENTDNAPLTMTGSTTVTVMRLMDGSFESMTQTRINKPVEALDIAVVNDCITAVLSADTDGNMQTTQDVEIFRIDDAGALSRYTNNSTDERGIQYAVVNGETVLAYYSGDTIRYTSDFENETVVSAENGACVSPDFLFVQGWDGTVLLTRTTAPDADHANVYASVWDGENWFGGVQITESPDDVKSFSACTDTEGVLQLVYSAAQYETEITEDNGDGSSTGTFDETVSLYTSAYARQMDAELEYVSFENNAVIPGQELPVTLYVKNNELSTIDWLAVSTACGEETSETWVYADVKPGQTAAIEFGYYVPESLKGLTDLEINASCDNDTNASNNTQTVQIGYTDLSLDIEKLSSAGYTSAILTISNRSAITSDAKVLLHKDSYDGEVVAEYTVLSIPAFGSRNYYLNTDTVNGNFASGDAVFVEVLATKEEDSTGDNQQFFTVAESYAEEFSYTVLDDHSIRIDKYNGSESELVIPETYDGYLVVELGGYSIPSTVNTITLPKTLKRIDSASFVSANTLTAIYVEHGNTAFLSENGILYSADKTKLICVPTAYENQKIVLPEAITSVGDYAFYNCSHLKEVALADGLKSIGDSAFHNCKNLYSVMIPDSVTNLGLWAFAGCTNLANVIIGNGVKAIRNFAFLDCKNLTSLIVGSGVQSIGVMAFFNCEGLTGVVLPDSVTAIYGEAFWCCTNLAYVHIPSSVEEIENTAFKRCSSLAYICSDTDKCYAKTFAQTHQIEFKICNGEHLVFYRGTCGENINWKLNEITGVLKITGTGDMYDYDSTGNVPWYPYRSIINTVIIDEGVTSIGDDAFYNCTSLTEVSIPGSVTRIGDAAFSWCLKLNNIMIPNSVKSIGRYAFYLCEELTNLEIPSGVTTIGDAAFCNCKCLTEISVSNANQTYKSIDGALFDSTATTLLQFPAGSNRTAYVIPNSVKNISNSAFYNCTGLTSISIPNGVTSIGEAAFSGCKNLTSVAIPSSVMTIDQGAFYRVYHIVYSGSASGSPWGATYFNLYVEDGCVYDSPSKTELYRCDRGKQGDWTIPDSVVSIHDEAFLGCRKLTGIFIPESVTSIGDGTFCYCTSLRIITVSSANKTYKSINGVLFDYAAERILLYPAGNSRATYTIPDGIKYIDRYAFHSAANLISVTIPNSVRILYRAAFYMCTSLTSITIPNGVAYLDEYAFGNCTSLTKITLSNSVSHIIHYAFRGCVNLTDVYYTGSISDRGKIYIGGLYNDCLTKAVWHYNYENILSGNCGKDGDNVTWTLNLTTGEMTISGTGKMADYSYLDNAPWYSYRDVIQTVTIGDGVTSIGASAFDGCENLAKVTIPHDVTSIRNGAFASCISLTNVTIPDSVLSIGDYAFHYCKNLTCVTIPDSVKSIGNHTFFCCANLTSVSIPYSVTKIGKAAFSSCLNLVSITVDVNNMFYSSDKTGVLYNKVKTQLIQYPTGNPCTQFTIPDSVTSIGYKAFSFSGMTSVTIPNSVTCISEGAFQNCTNLTVVTIPDKVTSIDGYAFQCCTNLTSVTIPDSVTSIGELAFVGCKSLADVYYAGSETQWKAIQIRNDNDSLLNAMIHFKQHEHSYTSEVTREPTCSAEGVRTYTCECGDSYTEAIAKKPHTEKQVRIEPTCTSVGSVYSVCAVCGEPLSKAQELAALGHAYSAVVTTEATCAAEGVRTFTCSRCGDSYTESIDKAAHTPQTVTEPATCTADGKQYTKCSVCGETLGEITVLPKIAHNFGEWVTVKEATTEAEGLQERTCTYGCDTKETQVLPKIPTKTVEDAGSGISLTYPKTAFADDAELKVEQAFDGAAFNLVDLNSEKNVVFDITMVKDGAAVQPNGRVTVRIPVPAGFDPAKCMVYHVNTETGKLEKMPARYEDGYMVFEADHFSYYAIVIEKPIPPTVAIRNFVASKTVDYRATITFTAEVTNAVPGAAVHWFINGQDKGASDTYTEKEAKANFTVQAKYVKDGKVLAESEVETVKVNTSFFAKLKAFFRALFGRLPKVVQEYLGVEIIDRVLP